MRSRAPPPIGQALAADGRADPVGADEHVTLGRAAVIQPQDDPAGALLVGDGRLPGLERITETGQQDLPERAAVHSGVRAGPLAGRPEVRLRAQHGQLVVEHDRLPAVGCDA